MILSFIGIGYGVWSDNLNMDMSVATGNIDPNILGNYSNDQISIELSQDNKTLYVYGDIYPSFRDNIPLDIIDRGSVPVALYNVDITSYNSIAELEEIGIVNRFDGFYKDADTIINSFLLNLEPKNDYKGIPTDSSASIDIVYDIEDGLSDIEMKINTIESEVNRVEEEISSLQEELDRINRVEHHNFTYELQFEQGI